MRNLAKNKWILFLLGLLLVANISLLLGFFVFGDNHDGQRGHREDNFKAFSNKMHLTPEQDKLIRDMKEKHFNDMKASWENIRMTRDSLFRQVGDPAQSDSLAREIAARLARLNNEADMKLFHHFQQVRSKCTPEQQSIFDTLVPHMMTRPWGANRKPDPPRN
jgi:hypothetical protein